MNNGIARPRRRACGNNRLDKFSSILNPCGICCSGRSGKIAEKFEITKRIISEIYENKKGNVPDSGKRDNSLKLLEEQMKLVFS